jgi:hypothetical protein
VVEPSVSYERLRRTNGEEVYSGYIARTRFNFQYNRELQLRMVAQYNDFSERFDLQPLLVYQRNPFTIFYIGSTYGSSSFDDHGFVGTDRPYVAKMQYLFRRERARCPRAPAYRDRQWEWIGSCRWTGSCR